MASIGLILHWEPTLTVSWVCRQVTFEEVYTFWTNHGKYANVRVIVDRELRT
jgi:hypothetical protein